MHTEKRGLRFEFRADAEVFPEGWSKSSRGRAKQLSLRGCFVEATGAFTEHQRVRVKISHSDESLECWAEVIYVLSNGVGLLFTDMTADARDVLQKWVLAALSRQTEEAPTR